MGWTLNDTEFPTAKVNAEMAFEAGLADSAVLTFAYGDAEAAAPLDADDDVVIKHPDGTVYFRGIAEAPQIVKNGGGANWVVNVLSRVSKLERITYKQPYAVAGGGTKYFGRVALGVGNDGTRRTTAQTISDILTYAGTVRGSGITTGSILSGTAVYWPPSSAGDANCLECIRQVLRVHPDAVLWYDHNSSTLNVTKPGSMSTVTKAGSGDDSYATGLSVRSARLRAVTGVVVTWYITTDVDGAQQVDFDEDTAGDVNSDRVLDFSIDIDGGRTVTQSQKVVTEDLPGSAVECTEEWLTRKFPELAAVGPILLTDPGAAPLAEVVSVTQTVDESAKEGTGTVPESDHGEGVVPWYERELVSGALPPWQSGISACPVTVTVKLKWKGDAAANPPLYALFTGAEKTLSMALQVRGTDAQSITYRTAATTPGEDPIAGLAAEYYAALGTEQPAGTASWSEATPDKNLKPGKKLSITGDTTVTGAVIQSVKVNTLTGRVSVSFGPMNRALSPEQWVSLQRNGGRSLPFTSASGSGRTDPEPKSATEVKGGTATARHNTARTAPEGADRGFRITQSDETHVKVSAGTIIDMVGQDFTIADPIHDGDGLWQGSPAVPGKLGRRVEIEASDPIGVDDGSIVWLKLRYTGIDGASDGYTTGGTVSTGLELSGDNVVMSVKMAMATALLLGVDYVVTGSGDPTPTDTQEAQHVKFAIIGITDDVMSIRPLLPEGTMFVPGVMYPYLYELSVGEA